MSKLTKLVSLDAQARARAREESELALRDYRQLYGYCRRYAEKWFVRHRMPECDLDDCVIDSVDDACVRLLRARRVRNRDAFMKRIAYCAAAQVLRRRTYRRNLVWIDSIPICDAPLDEADMDDEPLDEGFCISDEGEGAERVYDELDQDAEPPWMPLFRAAMARQGSAARKVLRALRRDSRHAVAAEFAGYSRGHFQRILEKIQSDFAQCFQAYRAYRAKIRM